MTNIDPKWANDIDVQFKKQEEFTKELKALLNKYSFDNLANTPDFILAEYLLDCFLIYRMAKKDTDKWFGNQPIKEKV